MAASNRTPSYRSTQYSEFKTSESCTIIYSTGLIIDFLKCGVLKLGDFENKVVNLQEYSHNVTKIKLHIYKKKVKVLREKKSTHDKNKVVIL